MHKIIPFLFLLGCATVPATPTTVLKDRTCWMNGRTICCPLIGIGPTGAVEVAQCVTKLTPTEQTTPFWPPPKGSLCETSGTPVDCETGK